MLSIISPSKDTSTIKRRETDKRKEFTESDEASLLINEEKHIGEIKYKAFLGEEKFDIFFL